MIKTYNPKEMKKWMEFAYIVAGIIFIVLGLFRKDGTLCILGFFFVLVVSNKTEILIDQKGLQINTSTLFLINRRQRLNFSEMDSVSISKGQNKAVVYFMTGWKGRKVLIDNDKIKNLKNIINKQKPQLLKEG
jgi:hypothetical protein